MDGKMVLPYILWLCTAELEGGKVVLRPREGPGEQDRDVDEITYTHTCLSLCDVRLRTLPASSFMFRNRHREL